MSSRLWRTLAVLALAGPVLALAGAAGAASNGALVITPNKGLSDNQTIHVTFSGYPANGTNAAVECSSAKPTSPTNCLSGATGVPDLKYPQGGPKGTGAFDIVVYRKVGPTDCQTAKTCVVLMTTLDKTEIVSAPIAFGPSSKGGTSHVLLYVGIGVAVVALGLGGIFGVRRRQSHG